jgi:hypothetical protein
LARIGSTSALDRQSRSKVSRISRTTPGSSMKIPTSRRVSSSDRLRLWLPTKAVSPSRMIARRHGDAAFRPAAAHFAEMTDDAHRRNFGAVLKQPEDVPIVQLRVVDQQPRRAAQKGFEAIPGIVR